MWKLLGFAIASSIVGVLLLAQAQPRNQWEGAKPYTPTRIDWLVTSLQASLREERMDSDGFQLEITSPDPDTVLIYVRYLPTVDRTVMNMDIDAARKVIDITTKSYGWQNWVKVREDVQMTKLTLGN